MSELSPGSCSIKEEIYNNMSWYPTETETIVDMGALGEC